jgi:hypothetical protein
MYVLMDDTRRHIESQVGGLQNAAQRAWSLVFPLRTREKYSNLLVI